MVDTAWERVSRRVAQLAPQTREFEPETEGLGVRKPVAALSQTAPPPPPDRLHPSQLDSARPCIGRSIAFQVATLFPIGEEKLSFIKFFSRRKTLFRAGCSAKAEELTTDLCSRKDAVRCQRLGETRSGIGRAIVFHKCPSTGRPFANGATIRCSWRGIHTDQASGDRSHSPGTTGIKKSRNEEGQHGVSII